VVDHRSIGAGAAEQGRATDLDADSTESHMLSIFSINRVDRPLLRDPVRGPGAPPFGDSMPHDRAT
jgi:hypothetical protein